MERHQDLAPSLGPTVNCEKRPLEFFTPIEVPALVNSATDLSTDQKNLFA